MTAAIEDKELRGQLPDGTGYVLRMPANWNQILLRDLDFAQWIDEPERQGRYQALLAQGYALAGTARHPLRQWQYDPVREIGNLEKVVDLFERQWSRADRVVQFGCSGGGHVGLAVSEAFHDRIDGTVAMGTHTPVWLMNTFLDGWFALKTLLSEHYVAAGLGDAADLRISGLPNDGSSDPTGHGMNGKIPQAWRNAFRAAQDSPLGRARLALSFAIGQWSPWLQLESSEPDLDDVDALQQSIFQSALQIAQSPGGEARIMFENAAQGRQPSWNEGVDYQQSYRNAAPAMCRTVEALYAKAGANLEQDIAAINDAPRIAASGYAQEFWKQPGRNVFGNPKIPVFRMHMVGDYQVPYSLVLGYREALEKNGGTDLARIAFVRRTGHCNFTNAEISTAVDRMVRRIEDGKWSDTAPAALIGRARELDAGSNAAFADIGPYEVARYNRLWLPD
ncbi:MAG: hypothetical protein R3E87_05020 [Burkholderiaceae bacterium]